MSDNSKTLKDDIEEFYKTNKVDEEFLRDQMKNFTPDEIAQMTTILSLYQPLLDTSRMIQTQLLHLNKSNQLMLPLECTGSMEVWLQEFSGLNERLKLFNQKDTMH